MFLSRKARCSGGVLCLSRANRQQHSFAYTRKKNAAKTTQVSGSGYKDVVDVLAGDTGTFTFTAADTTEVSTSAGGTAGVDGAAAAPTL
jgi:hypothetical protein